MRITIILTLSTFLVFTPSSYVFALDEATSSGQVVDIGYSKIHPASFFYFLKTVRENLELQFAQTSRVKNLRILEFAFRRLRETVTLVNINKEELIPPTLERYIVHLNSLTDKHQKNDPFAEVLKNNLSIHLQVLQQIYTSTSNLRSKIFIRSAMNRIIQRSDVDHQAQVAICELFSKEASSSALNKVEQVVLLERARKCLEIKK